jgi:hypothetical protein
MGDAMRLREMVGRRVIGAVDYEADFSSGEWVCSGCLLRKVEMESGRVPWLEGGAGFRLSPSSLDLVIKTDHILQ